MSSTYEAHAAALAKRRAGKATATPRQLARSGRINNGGERGKGLGNEKDNEHEHEYEPETERGEGDGDGVEAARGLSFAALGLDERFVQALQTAFPNVEKPTGIQERLIPEILAGKDVLLRDATGSGKSFGLVVALLNKKRKVIHEADGGTRRVITALLIVPHRDLALQLHRWIESLSRAMRPAPPVGEIAQVLVRGADRPIGETLGQLKATPPHILVCTPQALSEAYGMDKEALQLETLSTVVVDEVDYLVETAARKEAGKSFWKAHEKALRKVARHPGPTREMLDVIYAKRKKLAEEPYDAEEEGWESVSEWRKAMEEAAGIPQLVLASATLRVHLKDYLFGESGWLNASNLVKIMGDTSNAKRYGWKAERRIQHSVLIASDTEIRNIDSAVPGRAEQWETTVTSAEEEEERAMARARDDGEYYSTKYAETPSPFDGNALEAIASGFALDVPSIALLVIPASSPVQRAVWELRQLGVNAEQLDVNAVQRGGAHLLGSGVDVVRADPLLLVATLATTRGLDLPELTHVFVLGLADGPRVNGRSVDAYVHVAGRVGRFGRGGRVVSVVGSEEEGRKVERVLATLGEQVVRFEHFD